MVLHQVQGAPRRDRLVGAWLLALCALVVAMILVGGATRLTDSGLSITEWNVAKHFLPPLTDEGWRAEFELYKGTTEYQLQNHFMSLDDFREIYLWEWGHRFLGQTVGLVFAIPFIAFLATGRLRGGLWPILALGILGGLQGAVGWWMVKSGLVGRLDVSPVRLAVHLGLAFAILGVGLRLALAWLALPRAPSEGPARLWTWALVGLLYGQIILGALMAGSDAGQAYADWPTIGGEWIPSIYAEGASPWFLLTGHPASIQFHHRMSAYVFVLAALILAAAWAMRGRGPGVRAGLWTAGLAICQTGLGILTALQAAPLDLSLAHQAMAVALWAAAIVWTRAAAVR